MRILIPLLAVALLGAAFSPARIEPALLHVRWTTHYRDLTATADEDLRTARDAVANVPGLFPLTERGAPAEAHQRVRIVVTGRTLFDRALTREEARDFGDLEALHVANEVRGAGERDIAADGTAFLQFRSSPPGYRLVHATARLDFWGDVRRTDCDRKGSLEIERVASYGGTVARIVQRVNSFNCVAARPNVAEFAITSAGRTLYTSRATMTWRGAGAPPRVAGMLKITDGPVFVDFEGTGAPSIVLTGATGGVHCCYETHVFYRRTAHTYAEAVHDWGNGDSYPALLRDPRSGEVLFGSSNDAFAWLYGYGNAVEPVQIIAFERGRFLDVTPDFPAVVREQASRIWYRARALLRTRHIWEAQPALTAYLADMSTVGRGAEGWRNVVRECTAPDCARYLRDVRRVLRQLNYRLAGTFP